MDLDLTALHDQVDTIRTAFSYINRFKGHTFVIWIDGSLLGHNLFPVLIKDIVLLKKMGIRIALVPGARKRIDEILKTYNISCRHESNIRVTPPEAMAFVRLAAFDVCNQIMTLLSEDNCDAVIGNWVKARRLGVIDGVDFQYAGAVAKIKTDIVENLIATGFTPIFPNIGWSKSGKPYNISSTELVLTVAASLKATKLFFITEFGGIAAEGFTVPDGVYVSPDNILTQLTAPQARAFIDLNSSRKTDVHYEIIAMASRACDSGIERVHVIDGREEGMLLKEIFSNRGLGTMIYADPHENIRAATQADIPDILRLMRPFVKENTLVPRQREDIAAKIADYALYEVDGTLHACGALHPFPGKSGEIAGIAVDRLYANFGTGKKLVSYLIDKAAGLGLERVFLLTTRTADWFLELGFVETDVTALPEEKRAAYNTVRNSLILTYDLSRFGK